VLLNYGIDELRFTKPVYPEVSCISGLPAKKSSQDLKDENDIPKVSLNGWWKCWMNRGACGRSYYPDHGKTKTLISRRGAENLLNIYPTHETE
jgi:hypothetical protein